MDDGSVIKATIWDTAGEERFKALTNIYFKGAVGALLVYDTTDEKSFYSLKDWIDKIKEHSNYGVVILLVGNKKDLLERKKISTEEGENFAK
jgi:small GTP-binding protein